MTGFFADTRTAIVAFTLSNAGYQDGNVTYILYIDLVAAAQKAVLVPSQHSLQVMLATTLGDCADHSIDVKVASVQAV